MDTLVREFRWVVCMACLSCTTALYSVEIGHGADVPEDSGLDTPIVYVDGLELLVAGKIHDEENYTRLAQKFEDIVRTPVWNLSKHSAGITVRFKTDSPEIWAKWELMNFTQKGNMAAIGSSGLDLYCRVGSSWQYVNSAVPRGESTEATLITDMEASMKEFIIHLPLYASVLNLEIGIVKGSSIDRGRAFPDDENPIVFYGTSITQGASASRPGMAYPSIISRNIGRETINLGFSGNGRFEQSIGQVICESNPGFIVIDCTPNSAPEVIDKNALQLINQIRGCHPSIPILLVESIRREYSHFKRAADTVFGSYAYINRQNHALKQAYDQALKSGVKDLYYLRGDHLIGDDHEGTVDGTHLSDLGMVRIANHIQHEIQKILTK